jgi:hypothetical protein
MRVSEILATLPACLEWQVAFALPAVRAIAPDAVVRRMFCLPDGLPLDPWSHVVLTSESTALAPVKGQTLCGVGAASPPSRLAGPSFADRFAADCARFAIDDADGLGIGARPPHAPVVLFVRIADRCAEAWASFEQEPDPDACALLRAIGVTWTGGAWTGDRYVARLRTRLPIPFEAGALGAGSRADQGVRFFLRHGQLDPALEEGLLTAARQRVAGARANSRVVLAQLAAGALDEEWTLTCVPPSGDEFAYGDLVPLGLLLRALSLGPADEGPEAWRAARALVADRLLARRQGALWSYETGGLPTATDTGLVLLGLHDAKAVQALETFADGRGAYYPQVWSASPRPGHMLMAEHHRHWCQADYATTCLVRAARAAHGVEPATPLQYLADGFDRRAGLYFANPYLVDWALALALQGDPAAADLRGRLLAELLGSRNDDGSFGTYDRALSTSLAVLALTALGYTGRIAALAQLRLMELLDADGRSPAATLFYSTWKAPRGARDAQATVDVHGTSYELTLYRDDHRLMTTALAALALAEDCTIDRADPTAPASAHARYRAVDHQDYVRRFALPPYVTAAGGGADRRT